MRTRRSLRVLTRFFAGAILLAITPVLHGQTTTVAPPGAPVNITVTPAAPVPPPASIVLGPRHGHVTPSRCGFSHTGSGIIDVAQPAPDTVVVTMTGVAIAGGHPCRDSRAAMQFDLDQSFQVSFDSPKLRKAKLVVEGRVIGLLRSECKGIGSAEEGPGCATISEDQMELVTLCVPQHAVAGGENLSINDHDGPVEVPITAGKYTLHQVFTISAAHAKGLLHGKAASAEFAPDPALDPLWISYWEPFHGAVKKDFGFQVVIKVVEETGPTPTPAATARLTSR
jgi:hypothetical protein